MADLPNSFNPDFQLVPSTFSPSVLYLSLNAPGTVKKSRAQNAPPRRAPPPAAFFNCFNFPAVWPVNAGRTELTDSIKTPV